MIDSMADHPVRIRTLGRVDYAETWHAMQAFTLDRDASSIDEIWLVEHDPVFTQGQAGKAEHLLNPGDIEVVKVDRGGQVTYHGPGQLVAYVLLDMSRIGSDVRKLVSALELSIVNILALYGIVAAAKPHAPGVYAAERKICSLGLRIKKGRSFHGLALNVDMDLAPFLRINPCGYSGLEMTHMAHYTESPDLTLIGRQWVAAFCDLLAMRPVWI
ncbi:lipoyl(octanoyl) transferase LipB [Reinekea sp.]|uniref:lipoyl(octanoyl) transferase LipB n=1 Tax=Reinekea sp. TaxID=1970455 RepID=UPI0039C1877B